MLRRRLSEAPVYERDRLASHVLLDAGDFGSKHLAITWVEVPAGARQRPHLHPGSEQVYVVVQGNGTMTAGDEQTRVEPGDLVLIPPGATHAIATHGPGTLVYVSATSPPQSMAELYAPDLA